MRAGPLPRGVIDASGVRTSACTSGLRSLTTFYCCRFFQAKLSCEGLARSASQLENCGAGTEVPAPLRFQTKVVPRVVQCGLGGINMATWYCGGSGHDRCHRCPGTKQFVSSS